MTTRTKSDTVLNALRKRSPVYCACGAKLDVSSLDLFARFVCPHCSARMSVPGTLGGYLLLEEIGAGAMGVVFRAHDEALDRCVAIKVMRTASADERAIQSFLREARMAAKINHANIVQIHTVAREEAVPYIVMELVDGGHVGDWIRKGALADEQRVLQAGLEAVRGLSAAYDAGLLHGDIKPANLLLTRGGAVKIADFGTAEFFGHAGPREAVWGTPYYIAPERVRGERADHRADFFSLGTTLFHLLCGQPPFDGPTTRQAVDVRLRLDAPMLSGLRRDLHPATVDVVMRMVARGPADRHPTHASLIADLSRALDALRSPPDVRADKSAGGNRLFWLASVGAFLAVGAVFGVVASYHGKDRPGPLAATPPASRPAPVPVVSSPAVSGRVAGAVDAGGSAASNRVAPSFAGASAAPATAGQVDVSAARDFVGREITVTGIVTAARYLTSAKTRPTLLNFGPPFPNHTFTVVIRDSNRDRFAVPPEKDFLQASVRVRGTVQLHDGKPQMEVTDPSGIAKTGS